MRGAKFLGVGLTLVSLILFFMCNITTAQVVPGRYIVVFRDDVANPPAAAAAIARAKGFSVRHTYSTAIKGFSASIPAAALSGITANPRVAYVEPVLVVSTASTQVTPTGVDRIEADQNPTTGEGVNIAVIDTGIDLDHPDLNVHLGTSFIARSNEYGDDDNGHGTHVAGIAAALDNEFGVVGVAPGATVWPVKVLDKRGRGTTDGVVAGVDWVTANADYIEVANMSLRAIGASSAMHTAIQNSVAAGVVYVVAAGNDGVDVYYDGSFGGTDIIPAAYSEVSTISGLTDYDGKPGGLGGSPILADSDDSFYNSSNFSNSVVVDNPVESPGGAIDLMLPAKSIESTYKNGGYATSTGTSMASPHAAGLVALYIAHEGRANDASGVYAIRQALIDGGVAQDSDEGLFHLDDPDGNWENIGWAGVEDTDNPPSVSITNPSDGDTVFGLVTVIAVASDDDDVTQVEFFVDGKSIGVDSDSSGGWSASWDTTTVDDGTCTLTAKATDTAPQTTTSAGVEVTVDNGVDDPPLVSITSPSDGDIVSGSVTVTADASDDNGVTRVEFFVGVTSIGVDRDGFDGWSASWDTTADGGYTITAAATDTASQTTISADVIVTVVNTPPWVSISSPDGVGTVSGNVTVIANASDANGGIVTQVEFFVDGNSIGLGNEGSPDVWSINWNSTTVVNDLYTLTATATDTVGLTNSDSIGVTVDNLAGPTVSVSSINYATEGGRNGDKHLLITVALEDDQTNPNPVAGASVFITLNHDSGQWLFTGTTGTEGTVTFKLANAPPGYYTTVVNNVTAAGLTWDTITPLNEYTK